MAATIVQNLILQTGNGQNYLTWTIVPAATSYNVQRSLDGVNWGSSIVISGNPLNNFYLDTSSPATVIGGTYYYRVSASTGPTVWTPSSPAFITPCAPGQINLGYLRYEAKLRADMLRSNFVTTDEWNFMLNNSVNELRDILVTKFGEDYFLAPPLVIASTSALFYPLPDGTNNLQVNGIPNPAGTPALACYKVYGVDFNSYGAQLTNSQGWVSMSRFNWADHNKYNILLGAASNNVSGQYCAFQFREMGSNLYIIPTNTGQYFRLWYVPLAPQLLQDSDMMPYGYAAWWEYAVCDAAAKALAKQQLFDQAQDLMNKKNDLMIRIETTAANRNVGQPNTATNTRATMGDPNFSGPGMGGGAGWGGMGNGWGY